MELAAALTAQAVAIVAGIAAFLRWFLAQHVSDVEQARTLDRVASWFPDQTPGAPESLPAKVDRVEAIGIEALQVASQTGSDLLAHMQEEERLRREDSELRAERQAQLDRLLDQLTAGNPEVRST